MTNGDDFGSTAVAAMLRRPQISRHELGGEFTKKTHKCGWKLTCRWVSSPIGFGKVWDIGHHKNKPFALCRHVSITHISLSGTHKPLTSFLYSDMAYLFSMTQCSRRIYSREESELRQIAAQLGPAQRYVRYAAISSFQSTELVSDFKSIIDVNHRTCFTLFYRHF